MNTGHGNKEMNEVGVYHKFDLVGRQNNSKNLFYQSKTYDKIALHSFHGRAGHISSQINMLK